MDSGVCVLSQLSQLTLIDSSTVELEKATPAGEGRAQPVGPVKETAVVVVVKEELRSENVDAYEQRIKAALCAEISDEVRAKAQESLRSYLLHNPNQQSLVRIPSEKLVVENSDAVQQMVKLLADTGFPGAPETEEAVSAVGASALAKSLTSLFERVQGLLPPLTVTVEKREHHFVNPFMADYQSPHPRSSKKSAGVENNVDTPGAKPSPLPPLIPGTFTGKGFTTPPPIIRAIPAIISRAPPTPPPIPRSIPLELLVQPRAIETTPSNS